MIIGTFKTVLTGFHLWLEWHAHQESTRDWWPENCILHSTHSSHQIKHKILWTCLS